MAAQKEDSGVKVCCPICEAIEAYKRSRLAEHVRKAERKVLLSVRNLLDGQIERLSRCDCEAAKKVDVKQA